MIQPECPTCDVRTDTGGICRKCKIGFPNEKFKTIVMDVPWPIKPMILRKYKLSIPYKTMSLEEISNLPINEIADENCILFFWTTHRFLPDSFPIIKKYGFKYYVTLTWNKISGLTHQGFHRGTEFVVVAYKGKLTQSIKEKGNAIPCLFKEAKGPHSKKPQKLDNLILNSTFEPRADIFAREKKFGYVFSYGNDPNLKKPLVKSSIEVFF